MKWIEPVKAEPDVSLYGNKGASLIRMARLGMPVPRFAIIDPSGVYDSYDFRLQGEIVSVRSSGKISMPGMMDTILNVGLNSNLIYNDPIAYSLKEDYAQFIRDYEVLVNKKDSLPFDEHLASDKDIDTIINELLYIADGFPQDPQLQLERCIQAVRDSWKNDRATVYRNHLSLKQETPAVIVQSMVVLELFDTSDGAGSGVILTRTPETNKFGPYGDFLSNRLGDAIVSGSAFTEDITKYQETWWYDYLVECCRKVEEEWGSTCEIEFVVTGFSVFFLQCREAKFSTMLYREEMKDLSSYRKLGKGLVIQPANLEGVLALTSEQAIEQKEQGLSPILVRERTDPADIHGMIAADAIVTLTGGLVSHAAITARAWGKPCVVALNKEENNIELTDQILTDTKTGLTFQPGDAILLHEGALYACKGQ